MSDRLLAHRSSKSGFMHMFTSPRTNEWKLFAQEFEEVWDGAISIAKAEENAKKGISQLDDM